ncbi:MAG: UDP-glucose--hexose-1-phosphate uridylyltransferase [Kangiellaceae bacterium]|nr:UDP-glucose--hexose-1-phosphate uridylyltransferase [Kangiellaceae bacterium]MCW9000310.1 UDP-glucose--hexose-1-phosphate uridylyltransferase [Kangiellaceae bacterium]
MPSILDKNQYPHRRYNPLQDEWILVSPHRAKRPWQGQLEVSERTKLVEYDPDCYLCSGNARASGKTNPEYESTFVFSNDFAALSQDVPEFEDPDELLGCKSVKGESKVICFSPHHSKSLPLLSLREILEVINTWKSESAELGNRYHWVQVFENKGEVMGCSNPHPHGQVWAQNCLPSLVTRKQEQLTQYYERNGSSLLLDYVRKEQGLSERIVCENRDWIVVVPFWAKWPFETLLIAKFPVQRITDLSLTQSKSLSQILKLLTCKYDNLFRCSFPYSMGWQGAPFDQKDHPEWTLHAHFYPPLLRSASIRKFMVGYEMLAEAQRDITPEQAAEKLAQQESIHYQEGIAYSEKNNVR